MTLLMIIKMCEIKFSKKFCTCLERETGANWEQNIAITCNTEQNMRLSQAQHEQKAKQEVTGSVPESFILKVFQHRRQQHPKVGWVA